MIFKKLDFEPYGLKYAAVIATGVPDPAAPSKNAPRRTKVGNATSSVEKNQLFKGS